jgi:ABC-type transport system substrate-binding protein
VLRYFILLSSFFILLLLSFACKSEEKSKVKPSVFRYNEAAGITSLDPAFSRTFENLWAVNQLFEGLVQLDEKMEVQAAIAKNWELSEDGLIYTFHLRNDVYFHSNPLFEKRKVVAKDFLYSFNRIRDEKTASPGIWVFSKVAEDGFKVVDDSTFIISLEESFPPFLSILSMKYCSVLPKEAIDHYGDDFRANPIGSGPFAFKFWEENQLLTLVKNPDYYGKDKMGNPIPYIDAVSISFKKDQNAVFLDFLKGNYDMLQGIEGSYKEELLDENGNLRKEYQNALVLERSPWLKTDYLGFLLDSLVNEEVNPLLDIKVRSAINLAIDRKLMTKVLLRNLGSPAIGGFIPEGFPSHSEVMSQYQYQPGKAIALLKEAGYSGENPMSLVLNTTSAYADLSEFIQYQLSQVGIKIEVNIMESGNLNEMVAHSNLLLFKKSWLADYPDEENFMALFYSANFSPDGPNYTHFKSNEFDRLYEESIHVLDREKRIRLNQQMDSIVADGQAIVPLFYGQAVKFLRNNIKGLPDSPVNMLDLREVVMD